MVFNVSEFQSMISKPKFDGLASPSKFLVQINPPLFLSLAGSPAMEELSFFCDTSSLPGKTINTIDYKAQAYGDVEKIPVSKSFDPLPLTFFGDSQYTIMQFFQDWLGYIVQSDVNILPTEYGISRTSGIRAYREIGYKEDYASTITIKGFANNGSEQNVVEYVFYNAYPTQIGSIQMGWEQNDSIIKIPVEMTYTYYTMNKYIYQPSGAFTSPISLFTRLAQLGSIAGVLSTVRKPRDLQDLINLGTTIRTAKRGLGL